MNSEVVSEKVNEIKVFRIMPKVEQFYYTAEYTRVEGKWPTERYFTTNVPQYVGEFIRHESSGYGDGASHRSVFKNNNEIVYVNYKYEGTTSFIEKPTVDC